MKHILFWFFLVLALGIALGRAGLCPPPDPWVWAVVVSVALTGAWCVAWHSRLFAVMIVIAGLGLGVFLSAASPNLIRQQTWAAEIARTAGQRVELEGVMTEGRRFWRDGYGRDRYSFTIAAPGGGVRVFGMEAGPLPAYGEAVRVTGTIAIPGGRTNPAGFDWRTFLRTRGTYAVLRADRWTVTGPPRGWSGAVYALREKLVRQMDLALSETAADISKAIFLGERSELDPDFRRALVQTGTLHLFAISGFNVGFVALILFAALTVLRVPRAARSLTVLVLLIAYAVLVGDNSPVVRAVIMAGFLIGADLLKTKISSLQGLGAAGALMLAMNPEEVFDPAFQLSFAAVAGLATVVPLWGSIEDVRRARSDRWRSRIGAGLTLTVLTSLAAWIATGPVLIHHFNRFSTVAPVINILLVPIAFLLNLVLMIFTALACAVPAAAAWLAMPIEALIHGLMFLVDRFDRLPGASWNLAAWHTPVWILWAVWWFWLGRARRTVRRSLRVALSVLVFCGLIGADAARAHAFAPRVRATFFDVGQGNAALIELGTARILIDAGRGGDADAAGRVLIPYLASIGASSVDAILITHPQFDHAGGAAGLLKEIQVGGIWINGDRPTVDFFQNLLQDAARLKVPVRVLERGDRLIGLPAGAHLTVWHPARHSPDAGDLNERSMVLLLEAAGVKLLWTGDIGEFGFGELLLSRPIPRVDVLQVPHHGSRTGPNGGEFLERVRPGTAVISCGRENRYGHPHPSTLAALTGTAGNTHRTDLQGAFQLTVDRAGKRSGKTSSTTDLGVV